MVQVKGMRAEVQRFSSERTGRVKYSTSCPWRTDAPSAARRAIPTSLGFRSGNKGREATIKFAFCSPTIRALSGAVKSELSGVHRFTSIHQPHTDQTACGDSRRRRLCHPVWAGLGQLTLLRRDLEA